MPLFESATKAYMHITPRLVYAVSGQAIQPGKAHANQFLQYEICKRDDKLNVVKNCVVSSARRRLVYLLVVSDDLSSAAACLRTTQTTMFIFTIGLKQT